MPRNTKILLSIVLSIFITFGVINLFIPKKNIIHQIEDLRNYAQPKMDSVTLQIVKENRFFDSIQYLINSGRLDGADYVINKLIEKSSKNDHYLTLKGQVFHARHKYDSALYYYNYAIAINPNSGAKIERAATFIKTNKYPDAIKDYKAAYEYNYDFSYNLAYTFELNKQKDSALKYYNIYLEHYPDSLYQQLKQQGIYIKYPPDSARMKIKTILR